MKIRLEITLDNGTSKEIEIIGTPTQESIFNLINQLVNLYNVSSTQNDTELAPQQFPTAMNQSKPITNQPPQKRKNYPEKTRFFKIAEEEYNNLKNESLTIIERLELFLVYEYKDQWFTSLEVKSDYDRVYGHINLSTVSTYLSRLYRDDKLERMGNRNQRKYRVIKRVEPENYSFDPVSTMHTTL